MVYGENPKYYKWTISNFREGNMYTIDSFQELIDKKFPEEKITILEFNGVNGPISFKCELCGHITTLKQGQYLNHKKKKLACMNCHNNKDNIQKDYRNKINYLLKKHSDLEVIVPFTMVTKDMVFRCKKCGNVFNRKPNVFLKSQKCPYCESRSKLKPHNVFLEDVKKLYGEDYEILDRYKDSYTKIKVRHSCGFIYFTTPHNLLNGKQCPQCKRKISKGEKAITKFLELRKINFRTQYPIEVQEHHFSFDFFLPDYNLFIEFQGQQHYEPISYFGGEEKFKKQQVNDDIKRLWCKTHNFSLLEIKYTDINNIETILLNTLKLND